jgi:hypothetical protein
MAGTASAGNDRAGGEAMSTFKFITTRDAPNSMYVCQVRYCNSATHRLLGGVGSTEAEAKDDALAKLYELARDLQQWVLLNQKSEVAVTQPVDAHSPADVPAPETPHPPDTPKEHEDER